MTTSKFYIDGVAVTDIFTFPGGELHVRVPNDWAPASRPTITAHLRDSAGVLVLCLIVDALRARNGGVEPTLVLPYVPYARQDRVANIGEPLSIRAFAKIINSLEFASVKIADPHSDVTPALINRCTVVHQHELPWRWPLMPVVIIPDSGATKKAVLLDPVAHPVIGGGEVIQMGKTRNTATGKLSGFSILSSTIDAEAIRSRDAVIVDDICDGGGTFVGIVEALRAAGMRPKGMHLFVTHGIFSAGGERFNGVFDTIQTTASWDPDANRLSGYTGTFTRI